MAKLQLKQDQWKHLQVNLVIVVETTLQRMHRRENLSSGEIRKTSHQENGDCYESVPDKETGYRVGTEKRSSAVSSVGWLVRHANSATTCVDRRDSICTLLDQYVSHSDFLRWFSWGRIYARDDFV